MIVQKQMRVAFIIPGNGKGSSMIFARRLSAALTSRGMETSTYHLNTGVAHYRSSFTEVRRCLKEFKPDIVVAHYGTLTGFTAALLAGRKALVIFRGSDLNPWKGSLLWVWTSHFLSQFSALMAKRIVCVSKELQGRLWWRGRTADILPTGVDDQVFRPFEFASARRELKWESTERIVLFNASDPIVKRLDRALASVKIAESLLNAPIRLEVLTGETDPSRMPLLMSAANCLLVVSDYEGSPTVVQEAMACQLPVVSADVGDVSEMLADVTPSWVVSNDPQRIGIALAECLRLPVSTRSNGRQYMTRCSLTSIAEKMEQIFHQMLPSSVPKASTKDGGNLATQQPRPCYEVLRLQESLLHPANALHPGLEVEFWKPGLFRWIPPSLTWKSAIWSLYHHLRLFPNQDFCVLVIRDNDTVVHRTCFVPPYYRWPFPAANDLVATTVWTDSAYRRQGLASWALRVGCQKLRKQRRTFWTLVRENNSDSLSVFRGVGFTRVGSANRRPRLNIGALAQFQLKQS